MIGYLAGRVVFSEPESVVIEAGGVGYEVRVAHPESYLPGASAELFVHTIVRADAIALFGFTSLEERRLFELLLATPGVGPSTALGALGTIALDELTAAIDEGDAKAIARVPGIGPKTASRIVLELRGKLVAPPTPTALPESGVAEALRGLGYGPAEVREALEGLDVGGDEATALREALARLRRR